MRRGSSAEGDVSLEDTLALCGVGVFWRGGLLWRGSLDSRGGVISCGGPLSIETRFAAGEDLLAGDGLAEHGGVSFTEDNADLKDLSDREDSELTLDGAEVRDTGDPLRLLK